MSRRIRAPSARERLAVVGASDTLRVGVFKCGSGPVAGAGFVTVWVCHCVSGPESLTAGGVSVRLAGRLTERILVYLYSR